MDLLLYTKIAFWLTLGGVLFSGYLSAIKIFSKTCAFNEPCPYFLGHPACWYGFAMFFAMFVLVVLGLLKYVPLPMVMGGIVIISFLGILFASQYVFPEIRELINGVQHKYTLGLSTCSYGLLFYIALFILSAVSYFWQG